MGSLFLFFVNVEAMRMFLEEEKQRLNMEGIERRKRWERKKEVARIRPVRKEEGL